MRAQPAIEFLVTYSFLFLILGVILALVVFVATSPSKTAAPQCSAYTGLACNFMQIFSNSSGGYSLVTLSLTNSQSVPINITNMNVTINNNNYRAYCTPLLLYPGMGTTCVANTTSVLGTGAIIQGYYFMKARFCNSGVSNLSSGRCINEQVSYSGAFQTMPTATRPIVFSVVASQSPGLLQLLPYSILSGNVVQPNNYSILQNGVITTNATNGNVIYAYASNGPALGKIYFGYTTNLFPATLTLLNNPHATCVPPYNSTFTMASTTLYASAARSVSISMEADTAMEVFYRSAYPGNAFSSVFGGGAWVSSLASGPTAYGPNTITLSKGLNNIEVVWSQTCGSAGVQTFLITTSAPPTTTSTVLTTTLLSTSTSTSTTSTTSTSTTSTSTSSSSTTSTSSTSTTTTIQYVYCVAGYSSGSAQNNVYYAPISTTGIGAWSSTTAYPLSLYTHECAEYNHYVYCVAGYTGSYITNTYYAPVSSTGVGTWTATTAYPVATGNLRCDTNNGYIYCVGGHIAGPSSQSRVYYAPVSSTGIGSWTATTSYPIGMATGSCSIYNNYIFCQGGDNYPTNLQTVYSAPVSSTGVGVWATGTNYPIVDDYSSCAIYNGYMYCMAGNQNGMVVNDYYALLNSPMGAWAATTSYPFVTEIMGCVAYSGYVYCISGVSAGTAVYYAPVSSTGIGTWVSTTAYPINEYYHRCVLND